jgi:microcompartment protein CcmK/EutM
MNLGRVTGTLVATRKEPMLEGLPLLVVRQLNAEGEPTGA